MSYLQWGAATRLAEFELDRLRVALGARLTVIRPDANILASALDIDPARMKATFEAGAVKGRAALRTVYELGG